MMEGYRSQASQAIGSTIHDLVDRLTQDVQDITGSQNGTVNVSRIEEVYEDLIKRQAKNQTGGTGVIEPQNVTELVEFEIGQKLPEPVKQFIGRECRVKLTKILGDIGKSLQKQIRSFTNEEGTVDLVPALRKFGVSLRGEADGTLGDLSSQVESDLRDSGNEVTDFREIGRELKDQVVRGEQELLDEAERAEKMVRGAVVSLPEQGHRYEENLEEDIAEVVKDTEDSVTETEQSAIQSLSDQQAQSSVSLDLGQRGPEASGEQIIQGGPRGPGGPGGPGF